MERKDRYLFRGKRTDGGGWAKGVPFFAYPTDGCKMIQAMALHPDFVDDGDVYYSEGFPVVPETVGEFTGLRDKNGYMAFEHDIITHHFGNEVGVIRRGVYNNPFGDDGHGGHAGFYVDWVAGDHPQTLRKDLAYWMKLREIVGNIHDSPELLEVPGVDEFQRMTQEERQRLRVERRLGGKPKTRRYAVPARQYGLKMREQLDETEGYGDLIADRLFAQAMAAVAERPEPQWGQSLTVKALNDIQKTMERQWKADEERGERAFEALVAAVNTLYMTTGVAPVPAEHHIRRLMGRLAEVAEKGGKLVYRHGTGGHCVICGKRMKVASVCRECTDAWVGTRLRCRMREHPPSVSEADSSPIPGGTGEPLGGSMTRSYGKE